MNDEHRVSDSDRERAVVALRDASSEGRLTLEELSERTGLAYEARTHGELARVTADVPVGAPALPAPERRRTGWLVGVFVPLTRRGRWRVGARTVVVSLFSPVTLDLRSATFAHAEAELVVVSVFGPVTIAVPARVDAELSVFSIFAPATERGAPDAVPPEAPRLRVRGISLFGPLVLQHLRR